jgi:hypothetical protein
MSQSRRIMRNVSIHCMVIALAVVSATTTVVVDANSSILPKNELPVEPEGSRYPNAFKVTKVMLSSSFLPIELSFSFLTCFGFGCNPSFVHSSALLQKRLWSSIL